MKDIYFYSVITVLSLFIISCGSSSTDKNETNVSKFSKDHFANAEITGGDLTDIEYKGSTHAYSQPGVSLTPEHLDLHLVGDANFETSFSGVGISGTSVFDGLGPVQNNINCELCHQSDGRSNLPYLAHLPRLDSSIFVDLLGYHKFNDSGIFLRISIESEEINNAPKTKANYWGSPVPVPDFSDQLFHRGSMHVRERGSEGTGQADVWMKYEYKTVTFPDGHTVELSKPIFVVDNPYDAPDDPRVYNPIAFDKNSTSRLFKNDVKMGPRMGMPMIGLGLLSAINESDILALVDINDSDGDGVSGKPNWVYDKEKHDYCKNPINNLSCTENPPISLGRYGWKANTPTIAHQGLGAMRGDMGVTNPLFKTESIKGTTLMSTYKANNPQFVTYTDTNNTEDLDADLEFAQAAIFYLETLSVPPRRNIKDPVVQRGAEMFEQSGCIDCHVPSFTTGTNTGTYSKKHDRNPYLKVDENGSRIPELENQTIFPFTDMLLHDMGEPLADGRQDFDANGREWKTRPLWGLGVTQIVNPGAGFLHDGRARTIEEAILWLDGEALGHKTLFMHLPKSDRDAMIKFLESL